MTPERKKYLAGISEEERAVREEIISSQFMIKKYKKLLNSNLSNETALNSIKSNKNLIKMFKKLLPMKFICKQRCKTLKFCPVCGRAFSKTATSNYCIECGQALGWEWSE